MFKSLNMILTN